jgi:hypothetical protein
MFLEIHSLYSEAEDLIITGVLGLPNIEMACSVFSRKLNNCLLSAVSGAPRFDHPRDFAF